jgi:RsiW-degrading membrane proteinase PrsW (M82 family)
MAAQPQETPPPEGRRPVPPVREAPRPSFGGYPPWQRVLGIGLLLWIASVVDTAITSNLNMIPTVVLIGSFLVPVTAVVWYVDHYDSPTLTARRVLDALIVGGILGVLAASLLEAYLITNGAFAYLGVGLIEEGAKLLALIVIARGMPRYLTRDGVVLGAAVGFGFAALESSGYAFNALLVMQGSTIALSLPNLVFTEVLRGILSPLGHGLWTAILGGVLFTASRRVGHLRITVGVILAYLGVTLLHVLWDSMYGIAVLLTAALTATPVQQVAAAASQGTAGTTFDELIFAGLEVGGWIVLSLIGFGALMTVWNSARNRRARVV